MVIRCDHVRILPLGNGWAAEQESLQNSFWKYGTPRYKKIFCEVAFSPQRNGNTPRTLSRDENDSGILVAVPSKPIRPILVLMIAAALAFSTQARSPQAPAAPGQPAPQTPAPALQQTIPPGTQPGAGQPAPPRRTLAVVILDPAHGGADTGARGSSGISESDVVLGYARLVRISLEAQGLRVILTRQANDDPSFDDRSKLANAQRGGIFITLHVSSIGPPGTVRVYSLAQDTFLVPPVTSPHPGLLSW